MITYYQLTEGQAWRETERKMLPNGKVSVRSMGSVHPQNAFIEEYLTPAGITAVKITGYPESRWYDGCLWYGAERITERYELDMDDQGSVFLNETIVEEFFRINPTLRHNTMDHLLGTELE